MDHDDETLWRAMVSRDRRFEGVFVVGVRTTGIYCRPGCPARLPKRQNVVFFRHAAAAERAGFRTCLRCRPDRSPGAPLTLATPATLARALRLIGEGALDEANLEAFAERLGVSGRHLRRLFEAHVGASPQSVAQTQRVHLARQLVEGTSMPMTDIALAAGFASVRRFNGAFRAAAGVSPTELRRREKGGRSEVSGVVLRLPFRPPYDWQQVIGFLAPRAIPGIERITPDRYERTLDSGTIEICPDGPGHLRMTARLERTTDLLPVVGRARRMFDLDCDPRVIADCLRNDRRLARSVDAHPGLRVPGAWDPLEMAVRAILGQQVSVAHATRLAGRLVENFGIPTAGGGWVFPDAERLANADVAAIASAIGMPRARAEAIRALARLAFESPEALEQPERLMTLPGVGPWTASYVAMRVARDPDAFLEADLGIQKAMGGATPKEIVARAERWRPWRAYAAMHLWMTLHEVKR